MSPYGKNKSIQVTAPGKKIYKHLKSTSHIQAEKIL